MRIKTETIPALPADMFFLLDPDQRKAIELGTSSDEVWIHGQDQTKRLQVLAQLIINNVFEGSTTLVCANQDTEDQLIHLLNATGLDSAFHHLKRPISKSAMAALQLARKKGGKEVNAQQIGLALNQYKGWKDKIANKYIATNRKIFGDLTWKELVDKVAGGSDQTYASLLAASLQVSDFELTLKEYWQLRGRIKTFQRLRVLRTPAFDLLNQLHSNIFTQAQEEVLRPSTIKKLTEVVTNGRNLLVRIGELVHRYRKDVSGEHHFVLHQLGSEIDRVEEILDSGIAKYGNDFILESTFNEFAGKLKRSLSKKSQEMYVQRSELLKKFDTLVGEIANSAFAHQDEAAWQPSRNLEQMRNNLIEIRDYLDTKAREVDSYATTNKRRLNARNISTQHQLYSEIKTLENEIETFVLWVNNANLLQNQIEVNALSLEKCSLVVKDIVLGCKRLIEAMVDFEAYFLWRSFWAKLPENAHALMESLDILDDQDQIHAFDSWYFENILEQIPESHRVTENVPSEERKSMLRDIRAVVLNHIKVVTHQNRQTVLKELRTKGKGLHSGLASSNINSASEELNILPASTLSQLFPIVFCTPGQLRDYGYYFDSLLVSDNTGGDFKSYNAQSNRLVLCTKTIPSNIDSLSKKLNIKRLSVNTFRKPFTWNNLPSSDKLNSLNSLASQILPYIKDLKIYNARDIQIFSFMGDTCDKQILGALRTPYKVIGDGDIKDIRHITEALLDSQKPIILLTRDGVMRHDNAENLFWQHDVINQINACGIPVFNIWSAKLKQNGFTEIKNIITSIIARNSTPQLPKEEAVSA